MRLLPWPGLHEARFTGLLPLCGTPALRHKSWHTGKCRHHHASCLVCLLSIWWTEGRFPSADRLMQDSVVSGNTATGQGSVFNVGNAELVSFTNVTFTENSGVVVHLGTCACQFAWSPCTMQHGSASLSSSGYWASCGCRRAATRTALYNAAACARDCRWREPLSSGPAQH